MFGQIKYQHRFHKKIRVFVVTKYIKCIESLTNPQCIWLEAIKVHSSILKTHDGLRFENVFSILVFFAWLELDDKSVRWVFLNLDRPLYGICKKLKFKWLKVWNGAIREIFLCAGNFLGSYIPIFLEWLVSIFSDMLLRHIVLKKGTRYSRNITKLNKKTLPNRKMYLIASIWFTR